MTRASPSNIAQLRLTCNLSAAVERIIQASKKLSRQQDHVALRRMLRRRLIEHDDGCLVLRWAAQMVTNNARSECQEFIDDLYEHVAEHLGSGQSLFEASLD